MHSSITIESIDSEFDPPTHKNASTKDYLAKIYIFLAPFFNVSNNRLPHRFLSSLAPPLFFPEFRRVYSDLKGPIIVISILSIILFFGIFSTERTVFGDLLIIFKLTYCYWIFLAVLAFFLGYFCETFLSLSQYLSIIGYSFSGHCIVLIIAEVLHQEENHSVFFFLLTLFGGLSTCRLVLIIISRTPKPAQSMIMCSCLACLHLMHLIYIHFAFMRKKFKLP